MINNRSKSKSLCILFPVTETYQKSKSIQVKASQAKPSTEIEDVKEVNR
jgi:hypothetical protein